MGRKVVVTEYAWQTTGCDPCPTPPLTDDDLATLGLDVLEGIGVAPPRSEQARRRASAARAGHRQRAVVGADAAARALQQGDADRGPDLPRGEAGDGRARQLERHQRRRGRRRSTADGGINNFQGRYIIRHYWTGPVACKSPRCDNWGGPPDNPFGSARADGGEGAGDGAAREGRAQDRGALAGAAARHRGQAAARGGRRRSDHDERMSLVSVLGIAALAAASSRRRRGARRRSAASTSRAATRS